MVRLAVQFIVLLVLGDIAFALVNNSQIEARNELLDLETRRKSKHAKKSLSTSSSQAAGDSDSADDSLDLSESESKSNSYDPKKKNKHMPKSSAERKGWRKWHRKCTPCPDDMWKKWRDPSIDWICGAYQRARRSFKSLCMMHYRNCQDGTMFVKIHDHRCANSSSISPHGDHFFYEYRAPLSDDPSDSKTVTDSETNESSV